MALTFIEAIVDVGKTVDDYTVTKLKSHSKVGYQDTPLGYKQCSNCSMFTPAEKSVDGDPHCSLVRDPISPNGYCEEHDRLDRSDDVRERLASMLGVPIGKDGPPDEPRDERGRWTSGGGGDTGRIGGASARYTSPYRTRVKPYIPGAEIPRVRAEQQMREAEQKVADLQRQLSEHSQDKSEDLYWGVHRMLQQARDDLANLKSRIPAQKAYNPDEPRDEQGRWTAAGGDISKIISSSKLDSGHRSIDPENQASAWNLTHDYIPSYKDAVQELADFKPGNKNYEDIPPNERSQYRQELQETVDYRREEMVSEAKSIQKSLSRLSQKTDAYANRVRNTASAVSSRLAQEGISKAFNIDEPRDAIGRWTSGEGGPAHPDWMHGSEGNALAGSMDDVHQGMHDSVDKVEEARQNLEDVSSTAADHAEEEPNHEKDPQGFSTWEKINNANLADVADKTMALRQAVADHLDATAGVLKQLDERIQQRANENGVRGK